MSVNAYATSLRGDRGPPDRSVETGVPFFVPQLSKVKTNVMCQTKHQQHLLFCFEKPIESTASYRKQGNQDLYSEANLQRRQRLQDDPLVLAALARFWETFPNVRQGQATLSRRDYVDVFVKFFKALVAPSEFSIAEARHIVERDWQRDVADADTMTKPMFFKALFEVADIWTVGIGQQIYASFLHKLYDRVTMTIYDQEKRVWLTVFADLDKIRPFGIDQASAPSPTPATVLADTNQDNNNSSDESSVVLVADASTATAAASSITPVPSHPVVTASKPPLLKKKMMSVPSGLGASPTKSPAKHWIASADAMGSSMRRLPDLPRPPRSPAASSSSILQVPDAISRTEDRESSTKAADTSVADPSTSERVAPAPSLTRVNPKRSKDTQNAQGRSSMFKSNGGEDASPTTSVPLPELPPQQVRLSMPSIYLSPEITPSRGAEKAARRRIQESMKLAQRLRRITF